jgi:SAM-dependent methyltransferase
MFDYYQKNFKEYHKKTFNIDPSSFLLPLSEKLSPGTCILDIGCGSGRDLLWFRQRGFEVLGFERSHGLACLARKNVGCEVIEGNFRTYDFSRLSVDAIMLVGALVHLPHNRAAVLDYRFTWVEEIALKTTDSVCQFSRVKPHCRFLPRSWPFLLRGTYKNPVSN